MLKLGDLHFGDVIFEITQNNNSFKRNKIIMTDDQGVVWYRYDTPRYEYEILELVYCGRVKVDHFGSTRDQEDMRTQLHFRYPDGEIWWHYEDDLVEEYDKYFATREEAEAQIEKLKKSREE